MKTSSNEIKRYLADCRKGFLCEKYSVKMVSELLMQMNSWSSSAPFIDGLKTLGVFKFSEDEHLSMMLLCDHILQEGLRPIDYEWYDSHPNYKIICRGKEGLITRGIIRRACNTSDAPERASDQKERYLPTTQTFRQLFRDRKDLLSLTTLSKQAEIIVSSTIPQKELFFNEVNKGDIERLKMLLNPKEFQAIMDRLRAKGRKASASCLFYGAPGTGKTELAKQLAQATGRDLVIADAAKLYASWHGDTEKNVKELFEAYQYLQCVSDKAPILLFNEADGLLSKRTDVLRQAVDKIENRVQNLLLQALEDFEGIFIATTNLSENIDSAFERRFLYKICFQIPDSETRSKIWKSMIPDLSQSEAKILASRYSFSGGQIENIAKKRDIDEALFDKTTSLEQMFSYCENEVMISTEHDELDSANFYKQFFNIGGTVS